MLSSASRYEGNGSHVIKTLKDLLHISSRYKNAKELSDNNRILKITVLNGDYLSRNALKRKAII